MAVRRVRVLKNRKESQGELMSRLLEEKPRMSPERERYFAELISKGRMSEADFKKELAAMKKEGERPRHFWGGTKLRENISYKIRRFKKEIRG